MGIYVYINRNDNFCFSPIYNNEGKTQTKNKQIGKKIIVLTLIILMFVSLSSLFVNVSAMQLYLNYDDTHITNNDGIFSTFGSGIYSSCAGEVINITQNCYLSAVSFWITYSTNDHNWKVGTMRAAIWNATGTYGTDAKPTGAALEISTGVPFSDLRYFVNDVGTKFNGSWINFNFTSTTVLTTNTKYCIGVYADVGSDLNYGDLNHAPNIAEGTTYAGNKFHMYNQAWAGVAGYDVNFLLYTTGNYDDATPTPSPTPVATSRYGWTITPNVTFNLYSWGLTSNLVQGQGYTYTGNIISNSTPYGDGNYSYYTTGLKNNLNDAVTDLLAKTVNFNATGTYNINYAGTFSFYITPTYTQGSGYTYQGYLVNGTIRQTGETFESITVIVASEPTKDIRIYLSGGTFTNYELLTTVNFNQVNFGVTYTANGRLFLGSLLTGNYTYYLATTILTSSQLTAKNELFTNVSYGNVQNGIFQFVIAPRTYSSFPLYQGLQITINGTQKTFWLEFIGTVNGLFSSNPATPNPNEFGGGMSAQMIEWLIMMFLMFIPVIGATVAIAMLTHSGSATALVFFGAGLIDVIIGVLIGFIDWWVIIIFGVFLIIAAYAQFGKVTSGG